MDVVGSEIGQKMRSAIKAKLTELGCYVDDELPDYVMVMVANKRTRAQMEDDLQLFLGDNTELFVNWLHQVLKKLQEVTITTPLKPIEVETINERSTSKERKSKEKKLKDKVKKSDLKKAKKKDKDKTHRKKEEKKAHKSKKKSKHHEMIRPNVPPLLMNMEKDSEPSITDVFAGQILKNHGFSLDAVEDDPIIEEKKPVLVEPKRPILPIIDPATIPSQSETVLSCDTSRDDPDIIMITDTSSNILVTNAKEPIANETSEPVDDKEEELNEIEAKIEGLKQKLVQQMDSMSEDEDFLNIRTEADELMNDFAEDVFQEIASQIPPVATSPVIAKTPTPPPKPVEPQVKEPPKVIKEPVKEIEVLPQFELNLPKRPVRERLGARDGAKKVEVKEKEKEIEKKIEKKHESPERYTPEREPEPKPPSKSAKSRRGEHDELPKKNSQRDEPPKAEPSSKRLTSKVSVLERGGGWASRASGGVLRVRPRLRAAPGLLLRAVADAHRSLLNIPPKREPEPQVKRAMVLPMRRCVDAQKIVIQVPADRTTARAEASLDLDRDDEKSSRVSSETDKEYTPSLLSKKFANSGYVPSRRNEHRTSTRRDDTLIIETINIHNPTIDKDKNTQFIVTMDGYHPNAFLAKKLENEGLLNDDDDKNHKQPEPKVVDAGIEKETIEENVREKDKTPELSEETPKPELSCSKKRLSGSSEESDTQVIIKPEDIKVEKPKTDGKPKTKELDLSPPTKRRKASPIVFNVDKTEKAVERERERTESASSDNQVIVTTATNSHKYDDVPPLSLAERKLMWCRAFPLCRYGPTCAFQHPRCKFAASCTRRSCPYSHTPAPDLPALELNLPSASHVVPAANYKTISTAIPNMCKYFPSCVNPGCHYYHPKPCRYGAQCINKVECNFYHADSPSNWRYTL